MNTVYTQLYHARENSYLLRLYTGRHHQAGFRNLNKKTIRMQYKKNVILFSYSIFLFQPDEGYICIAETCSSFYMYDKAVYELYSYFLRLYTHTCTQRGVLYTKLPVLCFTERWTLSVIEWGSEILADFYSETEKMRTSRERGTDGRFRLKRIAQFADWILLAVYRSVVRLL